MSEKRPAVVFDIETEGLPPAEQIAAFEPDFEADARLKDPAKIKEDLAGKQAKWLERAALDAMRGRVLTIGVIIDEHAIIWEGSEVEILTMFWSSWNGSARHHVGHNIKKFDLPFMIRRSFANGIKVPSDVLPGRYYNDLFLDTMDIWAAGEYGAMISLDYLSRALGVGKKTGKGKDFAALYRADREKALAYQHHDLQLTKGCAMKMGVYP